MPDSLAPAGAPPVPRRKGFTQVDVVKVSQAYKAAKSDELSVEEGEIVCIIDKMMRHSISSGVLRYKVRVNNKEGFLPADILADSSEIDSPLHEACKRGNADFVKELMRAGSSVNSLDAADNTAIYWAARFGHLDCVKLLLAANPILDTTNSLGDTCLHGAAWGGHIEVVRLLLQQPNARELLAMPNNSGQSPYDLARNAECGALLQSPVTTNREAPRKNGRLSALGEQQEEEDDEEED